MLITLLLFSGPVPPKVAAKDTAPPELPPVAALVQDDEEEQIDGKWHGSVNAGANISEGNTEQRSFSITADAVRRTEKNRWTFGANYFFAEQVNDGATEFETSADRWEIGAKYDHFLSEKFYLLGQASAQSDALADLDLRSTVGAGAGYMFVDREGLEYSGEAGVAWLKEEFEVNTDSNTDYIAARLSHNLGYDINDNLAFAHTAALFPSLEDGDDIYGRADTYLDITMTEKMFARLQWLFYWDNTPATGFERADHRLQFTIGWAF